MTEHTAAKRLIAVDHRVAGQAADAKRNIQLVSKHFLLFPKKRRHVEGIVCFQFSEFLEITKCSNE